MLRGSYTILVEGTTLIGAGLVVESDVQEKKTLLEAEVGVAFYSVEFGTYKVDEGHKLPKGCFSNEDEVVEGLIAVVDEVVDENEEKQRRRGEECSIIERFVEDEGFKEEEEEEVVFDIESKPHDVI